MGKICKVEVTVHKIILYYIILMEECTLTNSVHKEQHSKEPIMKDRIISDDWKNCGEQSQIKDDYFSIPHIKTWNFYIHLNLGRIFVFLASLLFHLCKLSKTQNIKY